MDDKDKNNLDYWTNKPKIFTRKDRNVILLNNSLTCSRKGWVDVLLIDLLNNGIYDDARVITGHKGLTREVQTVNIMDCPDIILFLTPNELLLTNGYFMKQQPEVFIHLIRDMQRLRCSGLAIKTKRFELPIPDEILHEADRIEFPIIEISDVCLSLGEILQRSTSVILNNKSDELQYALSIHKKFSEMIMRGKGISGIIQSLSKLLSSPVILLNNKWKTIAATNQNANITELTSAAVSALHGLSDTSSPTSLCLIDSSLRERSCMLVYPVKTYRHEGYLLSFHTPDQWTGLYGLTLEQASNVIGMELTKSQAVKERSRRHKNEFFSDLIEGYITFEQEALNRGKKYGLRKGYSCVVLAIRNDEAAALKGDNLTEQEEQYEHIKRHFGALEHPFTMFTKHDTYCILLSIPDSGWDEAKLTEHLTGMLKHLHQENGMSMSVGIGKPAMNVLGVRHSYTEAVNALQFGYRFKRKQFVQSYQAKDIGYLFHMLPHDELKQFYESTLDGLLQIADESERKELLRTLNAFYETQCQLVETSKQLFVHRNTVVYRLEKCERLLDVKLKDPAESLRIRIALAIEPLLLQKV